MTHEGSMGTDRNPPSGTDKKTKKGQWHGGKGSARRKDTSQTKYEDGWERIFGKGKKD